MGQVGSHTGPGLSPVAGGADENGPLVRSPVDLQMGIQVVRPVLPVPPRFRVDGAGDLFRIEDGCPAEPVDDVEPGALVPLVACELIVQLPAVRRGKRRSDASYRGVGEGVRPLESNPSRATPVLRDFLHGQHVDAEVMASAGR